MPRISQFAQSLEHKEPTFRRLMREFYGLDPAAGLRDGRARDLSFNAGFKIFIADVMTGNLGFKLAETKVILGDLWPWFEKEGLLPEKTAKFKPREKPLKWRLYIFSASTRSGFYYKAEGKIQESMLPESGSVILRTYIGEIPVVPAIGSEWSPDERKALVLWISNLLDEFIHATQDLR